MYCGGFSKSCELAGVGSAIEVGFDYGLYYGGFSKSFEFADVGSAVEVGFDYGVWLVLRGIF